MIHTKDSVDTKRAIYSLAIMWDYSTLPKWVTEMPLSYYQSSHLPFSFAQHSVVTLSLGLINLKDEIELGIVCYNNS